MRIAGLEFSKVWRNEDGRKGFTITLYGRKIGHGVANDAGQYVVQAAGNSIIGRHNGLTLGTRKGLGYDRLVAAIHG